MLITTKEEQERQVQMELDHALREIERLQTENDKLRKSDTLTSTTVIASPTPVKPRSRLK